MLRPYSPENPGHARRLGNASVTASNGSSPTARPTADSGTNPTVASRIPLLKLPVAEAIFTACSFAPCNRARSVRPSASVSSAEPPT